VTNVFSPVSTITKAGVMKLKEDAERGGKPIVWREKRPVAGSLTFSGKRVRACEAAYDGFGRTFCTGHRYGSCQWSPRVRGSSRSTC